MNSHLEKAAKTQIKEDRELLREIGEGLSPVKQKEGETLEPDEDRGKVLNKLNRQSKR